MDLPRNSLARWQRKLGDSINTSNFNNSVSAINAINNSINASLNLSNIPFDGDNFNQFNVNCGGNGYKTPTGSCYNTPNKRAVTPGRITPGCKPVLNKSTHNSSHKTNSSKTPSGGDRFIPNRSNLNLEISHHLLTQIDKSCKENDEDDLKDHIKNTNAVLSETLIGTDLNSYRVISYQDKSSTSSFEGTSNNPKVVYSSTKHPASVKKTSRQIPTQPERILDAPDVKNDYYLQLCDWNSSNILAVALTREIYLWNANTGEIANLLELPENEYVSSVSWIEEGNCLGVGCSSGEVQLWDTEKMKRLRVMNGHSMRVSSLDWNSHILTSGSRSGVIHHHDVRIAQHHVGTLAGHTQEVCGLQWSPSGQYLASGGNDNTVRVWSNTISKDTENIDPVYTFTDHQAAVKALAWCPWSQKSNILATGGGTADRHIRIWNCSNGTNLYNVNTNSQVSSILWSKEYQELISSHGYCNNELIIWKYPGLTKLTELKGHTARILGLVMSPDGSTVASISADETLRFWACFQTDPERKKKKALSSQKDKMNNVLSMQHNIR